MTDQYDDPSSSTPARPERRLLLKQAAGLAMASSLIHVPAALGADRNDSSASPATARRHRGQGDARVILLGTAGGPRWYPNDNRRGIASAVVVGDSVYLVGCGEGVGDQYVRATQNGRDLPFDKMPFDALKGVFLTHLHSDHTIDLANLMMFGSYNGLQEQDTPIQLYGPGPRGVVTPLAPRPDGNMRHNVPMVDPKHPFEGTRYMVERLMQAFATDINDRIRDNDRPDPRTLFDIHDIELPDISGFKDANQTPHPDMAPFVIMEDDRVRVSATLVQHAPVWPAFAFRFDTDEGSVVFSGDTSPSDNLVRLASGADLLVHEVIDSVWLNALYPEPRTSAQEALIQHLFKSHTSEEDVGRIAERAGVQTCVMSHIVPGNANRKHLLRAQGYFSGLMLVGEDLMSLPIHHARG